MGPGKIANKISNQGALDDALQFLARKKHLPTSKKDLGWLLCVDTHADGRTGELVFDSKHLSSDLASKVRTSSKRLE